MIKRIFDIIFGLIFLILLGPILIVITLIVHVSSPGPIFYRGVRTGLHGKAFKIFKFRTMVHNGEALGGYSTAENDPRLTRIGRTLRRYKLDELPQLINILRGEMSFVGPRPEMQRLVVELKDKIPFYNERLLVKPGVTGWAQLHEPGSSLR